MVPNRRRTPRSCRLTIHRDLQFGFSPSATAEQHREGFDVRSAHPDLRCSGLPERERTSKLFCRFCPAGGAIDSLMALSVSRSILIFDTCADMPWWASKSHKLRHGRFDSSPAQFGCGYPVLKETVRLQWGDRSQFDLSIFGLPRENPAPDGSRSNNSPTQTRCGNPIEATTKGAGPLIEIRGSCKLKYLTGRRGQSMGAEAQMRFRFYTR